MVRKGYRALAVLAVLAALAALAALSWAALGAAAEALPDGVYVPDGFSFTGGSGRVTISCPEVEVAGGAATATLVFSSPNYPRAVVDGEEYAADHEGDTSVFRVPAPLNADFTVTATTTAMSQPHDIEYALHIRLDAAGPDEGWADPEPDAEEAAGNAPEAGAAPVPAAELPGLAWESSMPLRYAREFAVDYYAGGYKLLTIGDGNRYLVVPEGMEPPEGLDGSVRVIRRPVGGVYLAATSAMALFDALDALDAIRFSSLKAEGWTVERAAAAMERGDILFAGKYSEPDYELLLGGGCRLAIESTMILHAPKVREMIEQLGIPVFIERSAYEAHPLGRTEWIRLYGALLDREADAEAFFEGQARAIDALKDFPNTEKKVAFFYVSTDGSVVVRGADDYVPRMIELAGGRYVPEDGLPESGRSSVPLTMEAFYDAALDADFLVYNASIDDPLDSVDALLAKSPLFADFRAVRQGNVWTTDKSLYQAADCVGQLITDLHRMLTGGTEDMRFIRRLN